MQNNKVSFNNSRDAAQWLVNHPLEHLYDEYGNYVVWGPYSNVIEYNYEIDNENGIWYMDRYNIDEFISYFSQSHLETI